MKRAPWYVLAGAVAGFAGVFAAHSRPASPAAPSRAKAASGGQRGPGPSSATAGAAGQVRTATGGMMQYGYGQLDVRVAVRGTRIVNVTVPSIQTAEPYSQQLASQVIPMLNSQVLAADSSRINGVSGATYTSEAYAASLQAALDKLHFR